MELKWRLWLLLLCVLQATSKYVYEPTNGTSMPSVLFTLPVPGWSPIAGDSVKFAYDIFGADADGDGVVEGTLVVSINRQRGLVQPSPPVRYGFYSTLEGGTHVVKAWLEDTDGTKISNVASLEIDVYDPIAATDASVLARDYTRLPKEDHLQLFNKAKRVHRSDSEGAILLAARALYASPHDEEVVAFVGALLAMDGKTEAGYQVTRVACQLKPNDIMTLTNLLTISMDLNLPDDVVAAANNLFEIHPDPASTMVTVGSWMFETIGRDTAVRWLSSLSIDRNEFGTIASYTVELFERSNSRQEGEHFLATKLYQRPECEPVLREKGMYVNTKEEVPEAVNGHSEETTNSCAVSDDPCTADEALAEENSKNVTEGCYSLLGLLGRHFYRWANELRHGGDCETALLYYQRHDYVEAPTPNSMMMQSRCLDTLGRPKDSIAVLTRATTKFPNSVYLWSNLAVLSRGNGNLSRAGSANQRALQIKYNLPEVTFSAGLFLLANDNNPCIWRDHHWTVYSLLNITRQDITRTDITPSNGPLYGLAMNLPKDLQLGLARQETTSMLRSMDKYEETMLAFTSRATEGLRRRGVTRAHQNEGALRLHVGLLSQDIRRHPVCDLNMDLFQHINQSRFLLTVFSGGHNDNRFCRANVSHSVENFVDVKDVPYTRIAQMMVEKEVDILIDMSGYTAGQLFEVAALRPAPIVVHYIGYPGTLGASFLNYYIADDITVPPELDPFFLEPVWRMPYTAWMHSHHHPLAAPEVAHHFELNPGDMEADALFRGVASRTDSGLPPDAIVYCSFNQPYKLEPRVFALWASILERVPRSVIWLAPIGLSLTVENLRAELKARGVSSDRLVISSKQPKALHIERLPMASVALDTMHYGGGATTSDALFAGVPVVTVPGELFTNRMAASMLVAHGLPEFVTGSLREYEDVAVESGLDFDFLREARARAVSNRDTHMLFNTQQYTRNLEESFMQWWESVSLP